MDSVYLKYFSVPEADFHLVESHEEIKKKFNLDVTLKIEHCYYVILDPGTNPGSFHESYGERLKYLLSHSPLNPDLSRESTFSKTAYVVEIGPRLSFTTPFSTNAVSALRAAGIPNVSRLERSTRYQIHGVSLTHPTFTPEEIFPVFGDRMLECLYQDPMNFSLTQEGRESVVEIDVLSENGRKNLQKANDDLGLALDQADFEYYYDFFRNKVKKNPTDVELFDLAQSNSEHSRHWFFRGKLNVDGNLKSGSLFKSIQSTQDFSNKNNVIAFCDNSSAITGFDSKFLVPTNPTRDSELKLKNKQRHIIYTAETHNFPTGVCPFPGAATGTGGRLRDVHATGRGAHEIAGIAGYSVGNLHLDNYRQPWEDEDWTYPNNFASPKKILIEASNGASDYGNKFGEPVICGFARSFGMKLPNEKRSEYIKPIMFSGGVGSIDANLVKKEECEPGQLIAKFGGPVYRIGVGGGTASSVQVQGDQQDELDFGAVQRGDPEMEQKLHRIIRSCIELDERNPILSIHDQGAGGNGNVLKEIVEGKRGGAIIKADNFELGDPTISIRELWGAEYQESDATLIDSKLLSELNTISKREKCNINIVGEVTGDNVVVFKNYNGEHPENPVELNLSLLGERESKEFNLTTEHLALEPLRLPNNLTVTDALNLVLRLPAVSSKRYLTNKVDRSVTGLIAQQQCVGPLHTPVADVAVVALSYFDTVGAAVSIGEQPIKGFGDPAIGARMSVGEALTNLVFAPITVLQDVKCSGNWMWAAKIEGEGGKLVYACDSMCDVMKSLGIAVDGGKDSLSMAARLKNGDIVCAPGTLVISAYAPCIDVTKVVTPDFKVPTSTPTVVVYVPMAAKDSKYRLGGSALAQCYSQLGNEFPDLDDPEYFKKTFNVIQTLIKEELILSGHDVSDGGFVTALLEMAFAGNCGLQVSINSKKSPLETLFSEELGVVLEISSDKWNQVASVFEKQGVRIEKIGQAIPRYGPDASVIIEVNGEKVVNEGLNALRDMWEETSDRLELLQTENSCVRDQIEQRKTIKQITYVVNYDYTISQPLKEAPKIAILREEGCNGDREMAAAFMMAGFQAFDVTMTDLAEGVSLKEFKGIAFVGGFSYADVLGPAKGWSAALIYNDRVKEELKTFKNRKDTFSFGICNGCQLMGLIGWIGGTNGHNGKVFLAANRCARFHSGFVSVKVSKSPAIMLKNMENSVLGVWTSHGEGNFTYDSQLTVERLDSENLRCLRYVNAEGNPTTIYPENPNGSVDSVAGICSDDGRHLAMMSHPDRSFLSWQWPNYPDYLKQGSSSNFSPWIKLFRNAYDWSISQ
ncbi:hypothetical protein FO519_000547 [Halicephalobus sp. NKZ332]|nr:hypothetical protein FO519_000547 [Halicephalobus sp. NKZ332]